jgi:hypothetical protein
MPVSGLTIAILGGACSTDRSRELAHALRMPAWLRVYANSPLPFASRRESKLIVH